MKKFFKKHIKKIVVLIGLVIAGLIGKTLLSGGSSPVPSGVVESDGTKRTITLKKGDLASMINVKGIVQSNEVSSVSSNLNVKVTSLNVKVGDSVRKGDVIARLDDSDLIRELAEKKKASETERTLLQSSYDNLVNQKNQLESSKRDAIAEKDAKIGSKKASVDQKYTAYTQAQNDYNTALAEKAEVDVKLAELKAQLDAAIAAEQAAFEAKQDLTDLQKKKTEAQKALDDGKAVYNYDALEANCSAKKTVLDAVEAEYAQTSEAYNALIAEKNAVIKEMDNSIANMNANIKDAKTRLDSFDVNAGVRDLQDKIKDTVLKAETSGKITELKVAAGGIAMGTIATIQSTEKLKINANVQDYDISKISVGQKVRITNETNSEEVIGSLSNIAPAASEDGTFAIDISIPDTSNLYIGTSVKAQIIRSTKSNVYAVPLEAILEKDGKYYVLIQNAEGMFEESEITKGETTDTDAEITGKDIKDGVKVLATANWDILNQKAVQDVQASVGE